MYPWVIGQFFDRTGETALPWATLVLGVATFAVLHRRRPRPQSLALALGVLLASSSLARAIAVSAPRRRSS